MRKIINRMLIQCLGRDRTEYLSSNTMTELNQWLNPFIWTYDLKALVLKITRENKDVISVTLLPNQHWQGATAGQYIDLKLEIDGEVYTRSYSISEISSPLIRLTIKKVSGGRVSPWLHTHLKVGQILEISQPQGQFVYRDQPKLLFVCAGSGITPCFAIIHELLSQPGPLPDLELFAQFSEAEAVIFGAQLDQWRQRFPVKVVLSQTDPTAKLSVANFKQHFPDFQTRSIYLCAPEGLMQTVIETLEAEAYDLNRLQLEKYQMHCYQSPTDQLLPRVYFQQYNQEIQLTAADKQKTLLELGLEQGLNLEKGCQKGICGSCKLILHQGSVSGNSLGQAVYLCTAYPNSDYVVLGT